MDNKKKKKYVVPEAEIVDFANEDIITSSGDRWWGGTGDNNEPFPF